MMQITIYESAADVDQAASQLLFDIVSENPEASLGLATGGTPTGIYRAFRQIVNQSVISLSKVTCFNLDEYIGLTPGHPQSYKTYMEQHFYSGLDIPESNRFIPDGNAPDPEQECERYEQLVHRYPPFDLQLLGIGHNGHIGFNEPASELHSTTHVVTLDEETRQANARFFASPDEVPTQAITMGMATIFRARRLLLVAKGADKADILNRALTGPITTHIPASLLQLHSNVTVMADRDAARLLSL